jgi:hypothetical protein
MGKVLAGVVAFVLAIALVGGAGVALYVAGQQQQAAKGRVKGEPAGTVITGEPPARTTDWDGKTLTLKGCRIKHHQGSGLEVDWKGVRLQCDGQESEFHGLDGNVTITITGRCSIIDGSFIWLQDCKVSDITRP